MINSWSLLYDELYGDDEMTEDNTITPQESDEYDPKPQSDSDGADWNDPIITVGSGSTASAYSSVFNINLDTISDVSIDTAGIEGINLEADPAYIAPEFVNFSMDGVGLVDDAPSSFTTLSDNDDSIAHHITTPTPGIETDNPRKYKEDESIKALQDYISTTYGGHYTSKENNVQTLDLIESVGDAESFCRSNAIKYLSRYDKKGQAKRDILKALHYTLLLYHFSGQLNETPTRGYETF
jgi:hypothetical protein